MGAKAKKSEFWAFQIASFISICVFISMALLACIAFIQHQADDEEPLWKMGEKENTIFGIIAMILFCIVGFFGLYLWIRKFLVDYRKLGALSDEGDDDELLGGKESYNI